MKPLKIPFGIVLVGVLAWLAPVPIAGAPGTCESLKGLALPNVAITSADTVAAGRFAPPGGGSAAAFERLPAFCRVAATLTPSSDSDVKIEAWLPLSNWNGKLDEVGNGAFNGSIEYTAMAGALARGYATASTDTGHAGNSGRFALGHPEKVIDFGWRAVHEMTLTAKKIADTFYAAPPKYSYWTGCSAGGRQGLKEAQRFPGDFDGIVAGSPALDWTGRASQAVRIENVWTKGDGGAALNAEQAATVHAAALNACDAADGLKDGLISAPMRCRVPVASVLDFRQADAARTVYSPLAIRGENPGDAAGIRLIDGLYPGSELGWTTRGWTASARATGLDEFRYLVFKNPAWTVQLFNSVADPPRADREDAGVINANDPDLRSFLNRGGKLIQYHGWADPQISPGSSVQYYRSVLDAVGDSKKVDDGYRLFMAPGMGHCRGGEGPNTFDALAALEQWVEHGKAPDRIIASHSTNGRVDRTRPLCPFPQVAAYKGSGSIDDAANFACATDEAQVARKLEGSWALDKSRGQLDRPMQEHLDDLQQTLSIEIVGNVVAIATATVGLGGVCCETPSMRPPLPPGSHSLLPYVSTARYQVDDVTRPYLRNSDTFPQPIGLKTARWTANPVGFEVDEDENLTQHFALSADAQTLTIDNNNAGPPPGTPLFIRVFNRIP